MQKQLFLVYLSCVGFITSADEDGSNQYGNANRSSSNGIYPIKSQIHWGVYKRAFVKDLFFSINFFELSGCR